MNIEKIKQSRLKHNIKVREIHEKTGVNKLTIRQIMRGQGNPRLKTLEAIADSVGLTVQLIEK